MNVCIFCDEEIKTEEYLFKLKKGKYSSYNVGFRSSGLVIHNKCLMKFLWAKEHSDLKLRDETYEHLHKGTSIDDELFWKIGTYKITKMTQENIERIEINHYKKMAKALLSK